MPNYFKDWTPQQVASRNARINANIKKPPQKPTVVPANNPGVPQSAEPKQVVRDEPLGKEEGKGGNPKRFHVRIVSFRTRLIDPDNLTVKYFIDSLRYAELIPDDSPDKITLSVSQEKVKSKLEESTEITIIPETI